MGSFYLWSILLTGLITFVHLSLGETTRASSPPRGWNSYDSFSWTISEHEFLGNAELVAERLHSLGYEYVVLDFLWYRRRVDGAYADSLGYDVIDGWGRLVPDPGRWPSSTNGKGLADVAAKVHALGLKFGIHIMRGISTQAYIANTPILDVTTGKQYVENGKKWFAKDIGIPERVCPWMKNGFMSVNTNLGAGKAFLKSLHTQYVNWGVDLVKHDCVFGEDLQLDEITYVSSFFKSITRPIVYSLSPGVAVTPALALNVSGPGLVNMYRVTGDDWDKWEDVASHFDLARDLAAAHLIDANGLEGSSWPDLDMLPLGWLTDPAANVGPHRKCSLTPDEQRTQMTLWSIARSPLMFGGDVRNLDDATFAIISNPAALEVNFYSTLNQEFSYISSKPLSEGSEPGNLDKTTTLVLTKCEDDEARGWSTKSVENDLEQLCWEGQSNSQGNQECFCLYKRKPVLTSHELKKYKQQFDGKVHLLDTEMLESCLIATPNRKATASGIKRGSFSPCRLDASQMWELNDNGRLRNSHSGLCASVKKAAVASGPRAWIATGRNGEIYVAMFNLDGKKAEMSMKISDIGIVVPGRPLNSCTTKEVWSGRDFGQVKDTLSTPVQPHGTAFFVLHCN